MLKYYGLQIHQIFRRFFEENIIELKNVVKTFEGETVLKSINLEIKDKEFLTLLGPSGCKNYHPKNYSRI